jgi:GNAT superfamily N-acetyltransferase
MLYLAAHMAEGHEPFEGIYDHPELAKYVRGWPRANELGLISVEIDTGDLAGAAWLRFFPEGERDYGFVDTHTPELAIAVSPNHQGRGVATLLLQQLLAEAQAHYPAIRLYERAGFLVTNQVVNRVSTMSFLMVKRFN